jgi:hypothetical protein
MVSATHPQVMERCISDPNDTHIQPAVQVIEGDTNDDEKQ